MKNIFSFRLRLEFFLFLILAGSACQAPKEKEHVAQKPNIVLIMTDDQGFGDIGYNGNPVVKTPNLDGLAERSTSFTNFYVSPVCAPTRACLMTGRYFIRTGVYDTYNGGAMMSTDELTIAEILRDNGYKTGIFGKWHLGDNYPMRPIDQGFSEALVHGGGGVGQVGDVHNYFKFDTSYFNPILYHNGAAVQTAGYCSDVYTDYAIDFVKNRGDKPFFLYLPFNAPHTPLQLPDRYYEMYKDVNVDQSAFPAGQVQFPEMSEKDKEDARRVYGMVTNIDDNIGRLLLALEEEEVIDNTLVIFITDNGPQQRRYVGGLRNRKGSAYEGGIKVPCLFYYPERFPAGKEIGTPAAHLDILPTLLDFIGVQYPGNNKMDGQSMLPLLEGADQAFLDRPLVFHWQRGYPEQYRNMAIRMGNYKLVGNTDFHAGVEDLELYDLSVDPFEQQNIVGEKQDVALELKSTLDKWFDEAIRSKNNLSPPRITIGSKNQNLVILNRNDARGMPGIWAQNDIYGYWDITVAEAGVYDLYFKFRDTVPTPGQLIFKCGPFQHTVINNEDVAELMLSGCRLDKGDFKLESWYNGKGQFVLPFYVEIRKVN